MAANQLSLVCVPAVDGIAVAPCGTYNGQALAPTVLDQPTFSQATINAVEAAAQPLNYQEAGAFFSLSFGIVIALFLLGHSIGSVIGILRR